MQRAAEFLRGPLYCWDVLRFLESEIWGNWRMMGSSDGLGSPSYKVRQGVVVGKASFADPQSLTSRVGVIPYTVPNWCFLPAGFSDAD
jgi:hypothetical protein